MPLIMMKSGLPAASVAYMPTGACSPDSGEKAV